MQPRTTATVAHQLESSTCPPYTRMRQEEIVSHLEEYGVIVSTKLFEMNGKKQVLVLFETEEQATEALVCKHASTLGDSNIRISYSKLQTILVRPPPQWIGWIL